MGERAPRRLHRSAAACPRRGRRSPATARAVATRPVGQRTPRPYPYLAGRRPDRPTRRALLRQVRVWPASAFGHARRRRAIHGSPLPLILRATGLSSSPADGPEQLRPATAGDSSSAPAHARRPRPTHRRRWQSRDLSMGVAEENTLTNTVAAGDAVATRRRARGGEQPRGGAEPRAKACSRRPSGTTRPDRVAICRRPDSRADAALA